MPTSIPASLPPPFETLQMALVKTALDKLKAEEQFKPFAICLLASGEVAMCAVEGANLWEVLLNLKDTLRKGASAGDITAAGICVQTSYENPETRKSESSLSCLLETTGGDAARCIVPYSKGWFGKTSVEYADTAFGQSPIIFGNDPKEAYFSDQHLWYSLANELIDPYVIYQDRPRKPGVSASQMVADIGRGIDLLRKAIEVCPREPGPLFLLAKAHQALGDSRGEHEAFVRLSEVLPDNPDVALELTHSCLMLGKVDDALVAADQAARQKPDDPGILANLALTYLIAGRHAEAIRTIMKSLKINPSDPASRNLLLSIRAIGDGKWPQPRSLPELNKLWDKHPGVETR